MPQIVATIADEPSLTNNHPLTKPCISSAHIEIMNGSRKKVRILNTEIDNISMCELLQQLDAGVVFTPNVDHLIRLNKSKEFWDVYSIADYKTCDGQIVFFASHFLGTPFKERVSGSDLFPAFYTYHKDNPVITIFLLGASEGIAYQAQLNINSKVGRNIVVGFYSPSFGFESNESECQEIVEMINASNATVLAIGVGAPKQETWIYKYKNQLTSVKIFLAIGSTINLEAGFQRRPPQWISALGLTALYRISLEPRRLWKRYLVDDLPFFWLILKQKFKLLKSEF